MKGGVVMVSLFQHLLKCLYKFRRLGPIKEWWLHRLRPPEVEAHHLLDLCGRHGLQWLASFRLRCEPLDLTVLRICLVVLQHAALHFTGRDDPVAHVIEEHDVLALEGMHDTLDAPEGRHTVALAHVPDAVLIESPVGIENHTLGIARVGVFIERQGEEFEVVFATNLVNAVGDEVDGEAS